MNCHQIWINCGIRLAIWGALTCVANSLMAQPKNYAVSNAWTVQVGIHNQASPTLDTSGNIYITTIDGRLFAIDPQGAILWSFKFGFESASTPAIDTNGTIYFGSRNRLVYAVGHQGKKHWEFKTGGWVDASPALGADGTIYIGSWDKKFYALTPEGQLRWEFATGGPIVSSAAVDTAGTIYFGSHDRKFYALNSDGTLKWTFPTGGAILSSPAIGRDGALYFTSTAGNFYALNPDGTLRWKLSTGGINEASPVLGLNETIHVGVNSNHCGISGTGKLLWSYHMSPTGYPPFDWLVATPVALVDGAAITAGTDLLLSIHDQAGRWWTHSLGSRIRASPVITTDGKVYCVAAYSGLHALTNFPGPASSSWPMFRCNPQRTGRVTTKP